MDNNYFKNLRQRKGLLQSDQVLLSGGSTDSIVSEYSNSPRAFASDFAAAMIRMGDISPLTGQNGIIRTVCGSLNWSFKSLLHVFLLPSVFVFIWFFNSLCNVSRMK